MNVTLFLERMTWSGYDFSENLQDHQSQLLKKLQDACLSYPLCHRLWRVRQLRDLWLEAVPASHAEEVFKVQGASVLQPAVPGGALGPRAQGALQAPRLGQTV